MADPFFALMENALVPTTVGLPTGMPRAPQLPAAATTPTPAPQQPGGFEQVLRTALPALAGFFAARQGQLGTFTGAMADAQQQRAAQQFREEQLAMQQRRLEQEELQQAEALARDDRNYQERHSAMLSEAAGRVAQESARQRAAAEQERRRLIQGAVNAAAFDPKKNEMLRTLGPDAFTIDVPGIGPMNLAEALGEISNVPARLGAEPPREPRDPLITGYGPDGKTPTRVKDAPGVRVYERPRERPAAAEPKKPTVRVAADGMVTVADSVRGITRSYAPPDIEEKMAAQGIPLDRYEELIRDPEALAELVSQ
jgi:hypothetical protein